MNSALEAQVGEAVRFAAAHGETIAHVAELLTAATDALYEKVCCKAFIDRELENVRAAIQAGDFHLVHDLVRPHATRLRAVDTRDVYWDWIDAYNFYFDSLGSHWPYLTQEGRERYLIFAQESALIVCTN